MKKNGIAVRIHPEFRALMNKQKEYYASQLGTRRKSISDMKLTAMWARSGYFNKDILKKCPQLTKQKTRLRKK